MRPERQKDLQKGKAQKFPSKLRVKSEQLSGNGMLPKSKPIGESLSAVCALQHTPVLGWDNAMHALAAMQWCLPQPGWIEYLQKLRMMARDMALFLSQELR